MGRKMTTSAVTLTPPVWAAEFLSPHRLIPGGGKLDPAQFRSPDAVFVDVGAAGAAAAATTVPVVALSGPIPAGAFVDFNGTTKYLYTTAAAAAGATSLTVRPLATALVDADTGWWNGAEIKTLISGTVVGRTFAERAANTRFGPAAAADDEVFIVAFDHTDIAEDDGDVEFVKPGTSIKENFLPGWTGLAAAVQALVRLKYVTQVGVN